jgi:peptide deformylase
VNLELIPDNDSRLHSRAEILNTHTWLEFKETVTAMFTLMHAHDGIGLAAPQVGIMKRLFIMWNAGSSTMYVCVNPKVIKVGKETKVKDEGCLSYPGQSVLVERPTEVRVQYQNARGTTVTKKLRGTMARCFMHELDHLNGVVMADVGTIVPE